MDIFRYTSNAWGETTLQGVSWDLLWIFVGLSLTFVTFHLIYKSFEKNK